MKRQHTKNRTCCILLAASFLCVFSLPDRIFAAEDNITEHLSSDIVFETIPVLNSFNEDLVFTITQDSYGYFWFGTNNGLAKYDGIKTTIFKNDSSNPASLPGTSVQSLACGSDGTVWIGTNNGLCRIDSATNQISVLSGQSQSGCNINSISASDISVDASGNLWIGTWDNGLIYYNISNSSVREFSSKTGFNLTSDHVWDICISRNNLIWFGTDDGTLACLLPENENLTIYNYSPNNTSGLPENRSINSLLEDNTGNLWFGTDGGGLIKFNTGNSTFTQFKLGLSVSSSVWDIILDSKGILWLATFGNGLVKFDLATDTYTHYKADSISEYGLKDNTIYSIFQDQDNQIWLSTRYAGIQKFKYYDHGLDIVTILNEDGNPIRESITAIITAPNGTVWIGTDGFNLIRYETQSDLFRRYIYNAPIGQYIDNDFISSLAIDKRGNIWMGTYSGNLIGFCPETEDFINPNLGAQEIDSVSVTSLLYSFEKDILWIGTVSGTICSFNPQNFEFVNYWQEYGISMHSRIEQIINYGPNNLLLKTAGNLYNLNLSQHAIQPINNLPPNISKSEIMAIYLAGEKIWLCADKIYCLDLNLRLIFDLDVIQDYRIYNCTQFGTGIIWLQTSKGIAKIDQYEESISYYNLNVNWTYDALSNNFCFIDDNRLIIGSRNILMMVYTPNITQSNIPSQLILNSILAGTSMLPASVTNNNEINLSYKQNYLEFNFVLLDYLDSTHNVYAYKLEGFDSNWRYTDSTQPQAVYPDLPVGHYTFRLKAMNSEGLWTNTETLFNFKIDAPFWNEPWFYILCLAGFTGLVEIIVLSRTRYISQQNRKLEILVYNRTKALQREILRQKKIRSALNEQIRRRKALINSLVHELRTPLTPIIGSSEILLEKLEGDARLYRVAKNISSAAESMNQRIRDLVDSAKSEIGMLKIEKRPVDIQEFMSNLQDYLGTCACIKNQTFKFEISPDPQNIAIDEDRFRQVMINLINNSMKFSPSGSQIEITAGPENERWHVSVKDQGCGIEQKYLGKIFKPYFCINSANRDSQGMGLGLYIANQIIKLHGGRIWAKSEFGQGSEFIIDLPMDRK
ncbi:sensor histidine kinase [Dehalococcoides mccartyi]|uniref:histidine kinase n=1 Tax=Dehalococcoides mccartyi (strain VS) TaxID=311424 RepID=D2BG07_DEHMV|nr:sensor histidine kinase [Dehalococcoides mccartyi]ACZ61257.1 histidine kinase [Dehalococcoides mccartyi VS]